MLLKLPFVVTASALTCEDHVNNFPAGIYPPLPANYNNSNFAGTHFQITALPEPYSKNKIMKEYFTHYTSVFGIPMFASPLLEKNNGLWKLNHVANVLAQWLDTDMDGKVDDEKIGQVLAGKFKNHKGGEYSQGSIIMFHSDQDKEMHKFLEHTPDEFNIYWKDVDGTDITGDDDGNAGPSSNSTVRHKRHRDSHSTHHAHFVFLKEPQGSLKARGCDPSKPMHLQQPRRPWFDGAYEEPVHMMSVVGWVAAYPEAWAQGQGAPGGDDDFDDDHKAGQHSKYESKSWHLCVKAVGDCGWAYNHTLKKQCTGHYHYDDDTCDVLCQCTEMMYWSLTSLIGLQDFPGNKDDCAGEWDSNTPALMKQHLPEYVSLLQSTDYKLPAKAPNGIYKKPGDTTDLFAPANPDVYKSNFNFHLNQKYF